MEGVWEIHYHRQGEGHVGSGLLYARGGRIWAYDIGVFMTGNYRVVNDETRGHLEVVQWNRHIEPLMGEGLLEFKGGAGEARFNVTAWPIAAPDQHVTITLVRHDE